MLLDEAEVTEGIPATLEILNAKLIHQKGIIIKKITELRWYLFCKNRAESEKLHQTPGNLKQHVLRVHI